MDSSDRVREAEARLHGLFVAALDGDAAAYRAFLTGLASHLRAFFRRRLARLPDSVEDLVQDTLLAVHAQRHTWQRDLPLTAWVNAIARYKLVDHLRAHARRDALHEPWDDALEVFAASDTEAAQARRDLDQVLQHLPERQRQVLVMTRVHGASVAEAARATGMSESAVKVGVHRSLKLLAAKARGQP
jgi:RNA polymerase sigma-70 factor, ECF subfamily